MNILVFSWRDPKHPMSGGAEQVMHEHMKGWVNAGNKVTLFSSYYKGGEREETIDGILIKRQGVQLLGVHILGFYWYLFGSHEKYDLIVDQFHGIPFFTPIYSRLPKLAVVQEVARKIWFHNPLPKPLSYLVGAVGYLSEPFVFALYRKVLFMTGSQSAKDELIKIGISKDNITIVPHGVIIKKPVITPKKEKINTVIFLGAVTKDKGIEDALKCFELLSKKGNYQFWVVGRASNDYIKLLKEYSARDGMKGKLKYWGFVSQEDKFKLLARAHVLVNPSVLEGWGLVNIEANSMRTPVVAYRSQGLIDSVVDGKTGIICNENTPHELAKIIDNLLSDKAKFNNFQNEALIWSKKFSWKSSKEKSLDLIKKIGRN